MYITAIVVAIVAFFVCGMFPIPYEQGSFGDILGLYLMFYILIGMFVFPIVYFLF